MIQRPSKFVDHGRTGNALIAVVVIVEIILMFALFVGPR